MNRDSRLREDPLRREGAGLRDGRSRCAGLVCTFVLALLLAATGVPAASFAPAAAGCAAQSFDGERRAPIALVKAQPRKELVCGAVAAARATPRPQPRPRQIVTGGLPPLRAP